MTEPSVEQAVRELREDVSKVGPILSGNIRLVCDSNEEMHKLITDWHDYLDTPWQERSNEVWESVYARIAQYATAAPNGLSLRAELAEAHKRIEYLQGRYAQKKELLDIIMTAICEEWFMMFAKQGREIELLKRTLVNEALCTCWQYHICERCRALGRQFNKPVGAGAVTS